MSYVFVPALYHGGSNNLPVIRIVVHCTVSPCVVGGARNNGRWFQNPAAGGSAHLVTDPGETIRCVEDHVVAYHAPPNTRTLGIELCDPMNGNAARWTDANHRAMLERAAAAVAAWCKKHGVPALKLSVQQTAANVRGITGHIDVSNAFRLSDHWDPGPHFPWTFFISRIRAHISGVPTPSQEEDMTPAQIKQLAKATKDAFVGRMYGEAAYKKAEIALSWLSEGGIPEGVTKIYRTRLGREPDSKGMASWTKAARNATFEEVDKRIASSREGQRFAKK